MKVLANITTSPKTLDSAPEFDGVVTVKVKRPRDDVVSSAIVSYNAAAPCGSSSSSGSSGGGSSGPVTLSLVGAIQAREGKCMVTNYDELQVVRAGDAEKVRVTAQLKQKARTGTVVMELWRPMLDGESSATRAVWSKDWKDLLEWLHKCAAEREQASTSPASAPAPQPPPSASPPASGGAALSTVHRPFFSAVASSGFGLQPKPAPPASSVAASRLHSRLPGASTHAPPRAAANTTPSAAANATPQQSPWAAGPTTFPQMPPARHTAGINIESAVSNRSRAVARTGSFTPAASGGKFTPANRLGVGKSPFTGGVPSSAPAGYGGLSKCVWRALAVACWWRVLVARFGH